MTNKEAIEIIKCGDISNRWGEEGKEAEEMAIKALENISHLKDRPCEACEFKVDGNCTKWTCVFDAWLYSFVYGKGSE